jgi:hypothetical protein
LPDANQDELTKQQATGTQASKTGQLASAKEVAEAVVMGGKRKIVMKRWPCHGDAQVLAAGAGPTIAEVLTASGDRLGMVKEIMQAADLLAQDTTAGLGGSPEDVARRATLGAIAKAGTAVRVRVEIMGSPNCRIVRKSQSVLIMIP